MGRLDALPEIEFLPKENPLHLSTLSSQSKGRNCTASRRPEAEDPRSNRWCDKGWITLSVQSGKKSNKFTIFYNNPPASYWITAIARASVDRSHLPSWASSMRRGCFTTGSDFLHATIYTYLYNFILAGIIWSNRDHSEWFWIYGTCQLVPFCNLPQHLMFELRPQCKSCEIMISVHFRTKGKNGWFIWKIL